MNSRQAYTPRLSRRNFIGTMLAAGAGFTVLPRRLLGGPVYTPPSEELTKAVIGVGGMGTGHLKYAGSRLVAACDVDAGHLAKALKAHPGIAGFHDYRALLARPDIDIIHIATPDHWHGAISIAAAQAGKDVWCEKPMTHSIGEGLRVAHAMRRHGRIFRINTWFRFQSDFYDFHTPVKPIKKLAASGLLGWPLKVVVGPGQGFDWKLSQWSGRTHLTPESVPADLDYDFWLGPAPFKPYHPHRVHRTFRGYWDYCGGGLADMGQHYLDPAQYILAKDDTSPVEIEADTAQQHPDATAPWRRIRYRYADGCEIVLDGDGSLKDAPYLAGPTGKLFKGFKSDIPDLDKKLRAFPEPEPQLTDFAVAVRTRRPFALNERNGFRSATLVNLGVLALRLGRPLRFDPGRILFPDDPEANQLLNPPQRAPWCLA